MGQGVSRRCEVGPEQDAQGVCVSRPAQERKKKGRFFRWRRTSKETSIDDDNQQPETSNAQQTQCTNEDQPQSTQQPETLPSVSSCETFHRADEGSNAPHIDLSVDGQDSGCETLPSASSCETLHRADKGPKTPRIDLSVDGQGQDSGCETASERDDPIDTHNDTTWPDVEELIDLSLKPKTGDISQHYQRLRVLGHGSYGQVFEGIRLSDSRKVALKYVEKTGPLETVRTGLFGKSIPREVAMMALMNDGSNAPQIIKLLDWYETPDEYILVLERPVPCQDMRLYLLKQGGHIGESTARAVMRQVVTAARLYCERGIYHGDIKLENLLINKNTKQIKLIDFGTSKRLKTSAYSTFRGTKVYAPPESASHGKFHGKPATVYALGMVLFKLLSGKYPRTPQQLAEILTEPWYTEEISKECQDLISACMESDPAKRISMEKILLHDWFQALIPN